MSWQSDLEACKGELADLRKDKARLETLERFCLLAVGAGMTLVGPCNAEWTWNGQTTLREFIDDFSETVEADAAMEAEGGDLPLCCPCGDPECLA